MIPVPASEENVPEGVLPGSGWADPSVARDAFGEAQLPYAPVDV